MTHNNVVTVGIDGSTGAALALRWARTEAHARKALLRLVCASSWDDPGPSRPTVDMIPDITPSESREFAEIALADAVSLTLEALPDLRVETRAVDGHPAEVLIAEADRSALLVLGSRHVPSLGTNVLGSVSLRVAASSTCPVVVFRGAAVQNDQDAEVVVGVDTHWAEDELLRFAFEYADRHGLGLAAVSCRLPPAVWRGDWLSLDRPMNTENAELSESLAGWREKFPSVPVRAEVYRSHPVDGLASASTGQALLVVGNRDDRRTRHSRLGAVTQGVLQHARCPVAVVPTYTP